MKKICQVLFSICLLASTINVAVVQPAEAAETVIFKI